jgi:hypothetical protein
MPETRKERIDRELIELLNEIRVALPGVQVIFAFLLIVPFQQSFRAATEFEHILYYTAFLATTSASVFLIAPSTYHRIRFRDRDKENMLKVGNRLLLAGSVCMAVAITAVAFLISEYLYGGVVGGIASVVIGCMLAWFWYGLPLRRELRHQSSEEDEPPQNG